MLTRQGEIVRPQGPPSGPQGASEDMVLRTPQSAERRTVAAPSERGPPVPAPGEGLASVSEPPQLWIQPLTGTGHSGLTSGP